MKIIYIINRYPEVTATFIDREIRVLQKLGNISIQPVSIQRPLTLSAKLPEYQEIITGVKYVKPINWPTFIKAHIRFFFTQPLVYLGSLLYLVRHQHPNFRMRITTLYYFLLGVYTAQLLYKTEFDHIHAHFLDQSAVLAMTVARLLKKTYTLTAHANNIFSKKVLIKEKIINAQFLVTVSQFNKTYLLENYPELQAEKIHILHPWVDTAVFSPTQKRPPSDTLRILSVGRLVEKKGHQYLIEACARLKEANIKFECRIIGEGPLLKQIEALIAKYHMQDQIILMGLQPQKEVFRYLDEWADVFALPCVIASDGDRDGIPVSLAEAMAMEVPVISTDIVGIKELVQRGAGLLVTERNLDQLTEALKTIRAIPPAGKIEMGRRGRKVARNEFDLLSGIKKLDELFLQIKDSKKK